MYPPKSFSCCIFSLIFLVCRQCKNTHLIFFEFVPVRNSFNIEFYPYNEIGL